MIKNTGLVNYYAKMEAFIKDNGLKINSKEKDFIQIRKEIILRALFQKESHMEDVFFRKQTDQYTKGKCKMERKMGLEKTALRKEYHTKAIF